MTDGWESKGRGLKSAPCLFIGGLIVRAKARTYLRCNGKGEKQIPKGNDRKKGNGRNKYRFFGLKASSGLAGADGVAGPSSAVRMKPRTFAQDDRVGVGKKKGRGLKSAP
jgi:hypothetical protein